MPSKKSKKNNTVPEESGTGAKPLPKSTIVVSKTDFVAVFTGEINRGNTRGGSFRYGEENDIGNESDFDAVEGFTNRDLQEQDRLGRETGPPR